VNTSGEHFATIEIFLCNTSSHYMVVQCSTEHGLGNAVLFVLPFEYSISKITMKWSKICGGLCTNHLGESYIVACVGPVPHLYEVCSLHISFQKHSLSYKKTLLFAGRVINFAT